MKKQLLVLLASLMAVMAGCGREVSLFNGENLDGWVAVLDTAAVAPEQPTFSVADGMIHVTGTPFGYLRTVGSYSDYTLLLEWRWTGDRADSGIFNYLTSEDKVWPTGVQLQLRESDFGYFFSGHAMKGVDGFRKNALCETDPEKPDGEWNSVKIICKGGHIEAYVNGVLANEADCDATGGHIGIQSEGGAMDFRNIKLILNK